MKTCFRTSLTLLFVLIVSQLFGQIEISFTTSNYNGANVSCFGSKDGSITAQVTGGTPPYTFLWSNDATTQSITGLGAGFYNLTVTDSDSVQVEAGINLESPEPIELSLESPKYTNKYNVSCYECYNGSINTTISGGISPYSYQWQLETVTTQNRTNLGGGVYALLVLDANGCKSGQSITLTEPARSDWTMHGNGDTDPAYNYIGTSDQKDLVFKTNGVERLRIGSTGQIEMPSGSHFKKLLVNRISSDDSTVYIGDSSIVFSTFQNQIFSDATGTYKGIALCRQVPPTRAGSSFAYGLGSLAFGDFIKTHGVNSIAIGSGMGGVGLGNYLENWADNTLIVGFDSAVPTFVVNTRETNSPTGTVGICTTTVPLGYKLAVKGNIICEEVKVRLYADWDKVFLKEYELLPLSELKKFVLNNNHLPNIPSYKEMKSNDGISVGEFQMQLLRQVEEQALYILQQNELITELNERLKRLEVKVDMDE